jgi:hypothetical protein
LSCIVAHHPEAETVASRSDNRKNPLLPDDFRQAVAAVLQSLGWKITDWDDDSLKYLSENDKEQTANLENLYRRARREDPAEWPELITHFFTSIDSSMGKGLTEKPLAEFADQLRARIGPPYTATGKARPWSRPLGDSGLVVSIVIDFAASMAFVNEDQIDESGQSADEWLARALDNLHAHTPAGALKLVDEESGLRACQVGDSYDAARAVILDRLLPDHPNGFLVAVPHREMLIVLPPSVEVVAHFHHLKFLADKYHEDAPYAISDRVFWVRGLDWQEFPMTVTENRVVLTPPLEFLRAFGMIEAGEDDTSEGPE